MTTQPARMPYVGTLPLLIGIASLLCGLGVLASALPDREGSWGIAALARSDLQVADPHPSMRQPVSGPRPAASEATVLVMPHGQQAMPMAPRLGVQFVRDVPATMGATALTMATARWTESWYRTVVEDDVGVRGYLVRSSSARWAARWHRASWPGTTRAATARVQVHGPGDERSLGPRRSAIRHHRDRPYTFAG